MKINKNDLNKCGIYCIRNIVNNKVYIGKSINIYTRITGHISYLNNKSKNENRHLINSWHKYGRDNFEYFILEYFSEINEEKLKERELFWIDSYNSTNRDVGYNLRRDSSTKMIVHEETRKLISEVVKGEKNPNFGNNWTDEQKLKASIRLKEEFKSGKRIVNIEDCKKGIIAKKQLYKNFPELLEKNIEKQSTSSSKYKIYQYTKENVLIKVWNKVRDIIKDNPNYKKHNIYAVCSGEKPSMYGYIWVKILHDDIVRTT